MDSEIQSVIDDSKALLVLAEPAFAAQKKVAALEQSKTELTSKVASLEQKIAADGVIIQSVKTAADKAAEFFSQRGMLKVSREEFVAQLCENPAIIFDSVQKFADAATLQEPGAAAPSTPQTSDEIDPIVSFCNS